MSLTAFDRTTAVRPTDRPGVFDVELAHEWHTHRGVLGGSLVAIATQGIEALAGDDRLVRTVATTFFRTGQTGAATLSVERVHASRSVTAMVATVTQAGRALATTRATLVAERAGIEWSAPRRLVDVPVEQCVPIEPPAPTPAFEQADGLLDPSSLPFSGAPEARVRGYLRPRENRPVDAAWLAMAADFFPPPAFVRVAPPIGAVSIDLVTHVHHTLPPLGDAWLTAEFAVETSTAGLAVEHGRIATTDGVLLAESLHTRWAATA